MSFMALTSTLYFRVNDILLHLERVVNYINKNEYLIYHIIIWVFYVPCHLHFKKPSNICSGIAKCIDKWPHGRKVG